MSLVVAAPPRGELQAATWMARAVDHSTEETQSYNGASFEALLARFESATARGVATVVPPQTPVDKRYLDETGFQRPLMVQTPAQAELLVPAPNSLSLDALASAIGSERSVRAIDVASQHELADEWKLKQWMAYFATPAAQRERVLNLISLECSGTKLETLVRAPKVVREIGWVERHWATSAPKKDKLPAPKVALYCLMSAAGSYTEFHIDFGGSSVWYHLHRGRKFFFVIPPTNDNLTRFTQFEGKYEHGRAPFFGDLVARGDCTVIEMRAGDTMLLPSGWIHAVYTPEDSIAFGGNFLSSYHVASHMRCHRQELVDRVEGRFHFPDFECAVWYAAAYYGKMLATCPSLLTTWEWRGLRDLVPALEEWLASATTDPLLLERVAAICKVAVRVMPSAMLAKMRVTVDGKVKHFDGEDEDTGNESGTTKTGAPPINSLSRGYSSTSSSSSSPESSSESSDSSTDDSDDDTGHGSDHDREATDDGGNTNPENSNSSDSSSDDDSSSSSSSSDEEDAEERKEPEETKEPEQEKEAEEEEVELDEPEESSSSESDNDDDPDPENAYPELPPVPIEALIAIRKRAKLKDLQITKAGKEHVLALAHQHRLEAQHPSKNKKKTKANGAVAAEAAVITPWAEEDRWTVACSCGLGGENYDDGRMMVECNNCNNWVHGECVRIPIQEIFWCFKCRSPESNDWLFVCPCGIKEKNYDDGARMVQCDNCEIWQHTYCAGIPDTEDPPEKFMCKVCSKAPKKPRASVKGTQKKTKKKATTTKAKQQTQAFELLSPMSKLVSVAIETAPASVSTTIPASPSEPHSQGMSPPPPPPPPPSAPPSPTPAVDSIEEEAYTPPKQRKRGRTSSKSKSNEKSRKRPQKEDPSGAHEIPPSPAGVQGVPTIVQRPPLPNQSKSSSQTAKRKSGGGSARDRLEKKLKIRKPRL